jgi:hypothetical protein
LNLNPDAGRRWQHWGAIRTAAHYGRHDAIDGVKVASEPDALLARQLPTQLLETTGVGGGLDKGTGARAPIQAQFCAGFRAANHRGRTIGGFISPGIALSMSKRH